MTMVHIRLRAPTNGGTRAGVGMVVFQPSARHTDDASVVLPDTFTVVLDEEGEATVDIQPTGPNWCWKTDEQVPYEVPQGLTDELLRQAGGRYSHSSR